MSWGYHGIYCGKRLGLWSGQLCENFGSRFYHRTQWGMCKLKLWSEATYTSYTRRPLKINMWKNIIRYCTHNFRVSVFFWGWFGQLFQLMQSHGVGVTAGDWYHEAWRLNHAPQSSIFGEISGLWWIENPGRVWFMFDGVFDGFWWYIMVHPNAVTLCLSEPWQWEVHVSHGEFATGTSQVLTVQYRRFWCLLLNSHSYAKCQKGLGFWSVLGSALECFSPQPWSPIFFLCGKRVLA